MKMTKKHSFILFYTIVTVRQYMYNQKDTILYDACILR